MLKKILCIGLMGLFLSLSAYEQDDLNLVLNPKCIGVFKLDLRGVNLSGANLSCRNFISVDFRGAVLEGVDFTGSHFIDCIFTDAYFGNSVKLEGVIFLSCNMYKARYNCEYFLENCLYPDPVSTKTLNGDFFGVTFINGCEGHPDAHLCKDIQDECERQAAVYSQNGQCEILHDDDGTEWILTPEIIKILDQGVPAQKK